MTELLLGTWNNILSTLAVTIPPLLWIPLVSFLVLVNLLFLQYRSLSTLPLLLWIPLKSFLTLINTSFLQYMSLPGLPLSFLTVPSTLFNLSDSCECLLVTNGWWSMHYNSRVIFISSFLNSSHWPHPQQPLTLQICTQVCLWTYLWVSPSLSSYNLSLPSCWYGQFLVIVYFLGYSWRYPQGD